MVCLVSGILFFSGKLNSFGLVATRDSTRVLPHTGYVFKQDLRDLSDGTNH